MQPQDAKKLRFFTPVLPALGALLPEFDNLLWDGLEGGYRIPYDPRPSLLELLENNQQQALEKLFENLYHQGDVGISSYAAVPFLIKVGALDLAGAIEAARHSPQNPELPAWLEVEYENSLRDALNQSPKSEANLLGYYIIHASLSGSTQLVRALHLMSPEEILNDYDSFS